MASKICTFHPFFLAPQGLDLALLAAVTAIDSLALHCTGSTAVNSLFSTKTNQDLSWEFETADATN